MTIHPILRRHWLRIAVGSALTVFFFANSGFRGLVRNWRELRRLRGEIEAVSRQERALNERLLALRAGDGSVERLARKELGYMRRGEIEYRFPPPR